MRSSHLTGGSALLLAIGFNLPFALLAAEFDYPDILRQPPGRVLEAFAVGGPRLVLIWYGFLLSAVGLMLFAPAVALVGRKVDGLAVTAALIGALAGLAQAIGLARWVFAVPMLAAAHGAADPAGRAAIEVGFVVLNQWGGVAIGEHLGQMLTAIWLALTLVQGRKAGFWFALAAGAGWLAAAGILLGLGEGLALAVGQSGEGFALATVAGYLALSAWLVLTGIALLRQRTQTLA